MATVKEINYSIMFGALSNAELDSVADALRFARAELSKRTKRSLAVGIPVKFTSAKHGRTVAGTVSKIGRTYIYVREAPGAGRLFGTNWRVPANMVEAA